MRREEGRSTADAEPTLGDDLPVGPGAGRLPHSDAVALSSATLFASYHERIRRYIQSMVHDPAEADDLTQETFLQAHRGLESLRDANAVAAWLYRIATRVCYDRFRKSARQPSLKSLDVSGSDGATSLRDRTDEPTLDQVIERTEMSACVRSFLDNLSNDYRQAILLHDLEGLTNVEIAEMLGMSLAAVKIRVHRARQKLQAALAANCDFSYDERGVFVCERTAPTQPV